MPDRVNGGLSRRRFLKGTAAGLTGLGVAAAAGSWVLMGANGDEEAAMGAKGLASGLSGPMVAYVRDAAKGEVVLMVGTREIVRKDPGLVAQLARCCEA